MITITEFVAREVHYNCSHLISELAKNDSNEYFDELMSICSSEEDYKTAALDEGWEVIERGDVKVLMKGEFIYDPQSEAVDHRGKLLDDLGFIDYADYAIDDDDDQDVWRSLCECKDIDPYNHEALQHWIVSDWLADKLIEHGEMVSKDIYGLTVWGRACCGQAIADDSVIQQIYQDTRI